MNHEMKNNHITYQVHREFTGNQTASDLIKNRIREELDAKNPLTTTGLTVYNKRGSVHPQEET